MKAGSATGVANRLLAQAARLLKTGLAQMPALCFRLFRHLAERRGQRLKINSTKSLRLRLSIFFAIFLAVTWLSAAAFAWHECRKYINEFFDTEQLMFAKMLAASNMPESRVMLPETRQIISSGGKKAWGKQEDDALGFAVFSRKGELLLGDSDNGRRFVFSGSAQGFVNAPIAGSKKLWRIVWVESADKQRLIAVGQELDYRFDLAADLLKEQILPWLLLLPILLLGLIALLTRELAPLQGVAKNLQNRTPDDATLLDTKSIPAEVRPMVASLNSLFTRTSHMLERERSFISDAAHELRTPLAGLRVQAQVAADPEIAPALRAEALANLQQGIDRSARLVDQLLALSRLEAMQSPSKNTAMPADNQEYALLNWPDIIKEIVDVYNDKAIIKKIKINCDIPSKHMPVKGCPTLASMLARNLLDNAVAYTPEGGCIHVTLTDKALIVANDAAPLPEDYAQRLGERFFRPPGQDHHGSGLGISIIKRIAEIHGFGFKLDSGAATNAESPSIFKISIIWRA